MGRNSKSSRLKAALSDTLAPRTPAAPEKLDEILRKHANPASTPAVSPATTAAPSTPPSTRPSPGAPAAPARDFQRVANSITREALPGGVFNGKAKQLYDCLYSLTRGAIVPALSVRISRAELMRKSDIGAKVTLEQNLRRLIAAGLVTMKTIGGIQGGNEYTVRLPEEVTVPSTGTRGPSTPSGGENLGVLAPLETSPPSPGVSADLERTSGDGKTSFKTNTNTDDEGAALSDLNSLFAGAARQLTGKSLKPSERERWRELAELLVTELKIAAARTGSVSSVPAFLTEHLRRRLWKIDTKQGREAPEVSTPQSALSSEQIKACPDCGGTGFYYPKGYEGGVARCRHERLNESK